MFRQTHQRKKKVGLNLDQTIAERKAYLKQIEEQIDIVTLAGNDKIKDIQDEIEQLDQERARLLKLNFGIEQRIRENKHILEEQERGIIL